MKLTQKFIFMILLMFGLKCQAMEQQLELGFGGLPPELKLHLLSFTKAGNLIDLFKKLSLISQTERETYALTQDESLIKSLITNHIEEQLKNKSLEQIMPEIIEAQDFIQKHLKKDKGIVNKKLLEVINKVYNPIIKGLSRKYLNLEGKGEQALNIELFKAIRLNEIDKVKLLLIIGVNPNIEHPVLKNSALISAVIKEEKEITRSLLNAGANPNAKDQIGRTALIIAAFKNNNEIVTMLLDAGANPNIQQNIESKYTSLMWAAWHNDKSIVEALLKAGAKLDPKNSDGETALKVAQRRNSYDAANMIKEYLLK